MLNNKEKSQNFLEFIRTYNKEIIGGGIIGVLLFSVD
jgi:hypothetical protein